jgi:hypothetical protein
MTAKPKFKYSFRDRDGNLVWQTENQHQRARRARNSARTPEQIIAARDLRHPAGLKWCNGCNRALSFSAFGTSSRQGDGLHRRCLKCDAARIAARDAAQAASE